MEKSHWNGKTWYAYGTSMTSIEQGEYVPVVEKLSGLIIKTFGIDFVIGIIDRIKRDEKC